MEAIEVVEAVEAVEAVEKTFCSKMRPSVIFYSLKLAMASNGLEGCGGRPQVVIEATEVVEAA